MDRWADCAYAADAEKVTKVCADAETARVSFSAANTEFYGAQS